MNDGLYNSYMKPVGYMNHWKAFHLKHNRCRQDRLFTYDLTEIWSRRRTTCADIFVYCKCFWRQTPETSTWIIYINMDSNSVWSQAPPSYFVCQTMSYQCDECEERYTAELMGLFKGWLGPMMKDIVHHLFSLQSLVVKDEANATTHHLQPTSTVKNGATLTHNGHWDTEKENRWRVTVDSNYSCCQHQSTSSHVEVFCWQNLCYTCHWRKELT